MTKCLNCGASFSNDAPKCPYCGQIYIAGAQKEYMDNLQDMKNEMSEVSELSENIYHEEVKKNIRKIRFFIILFLGLFLLGVIIYAGINKMFSYVESEEDFKARILWERENFPILDDLYLEEKYSEILKFMEKAFSEEGYLCEQWEHYDFITYYEDYNICLEILAVCKNGNEITGYEAGELLYRGLSVMNFDAEKESYVIEAFTESEKIKLQQWKQNLENIFFDELKFTHEEMDIIQKEVYKDGYLSYEACKSYRKTILEKIADEM